MVRATLRPSLLIAAALAAVHAGAAATLLPLDVPAEYKLVAAFLITASLARSLWHHALLRAKRAIVEIQIADQENGAICGREGTWRNAKVLGTTYVTPVLTVINVRASGARFPSHVLLTRDNIDQDDFRKIRVLLRWARAKPVEGATAEEFDRPLV